MITDAFPEIAKQVGRWQDALYKCKNLNDNDKLGLTVSFCVAFAIEIYDKPTLEQVSIVAGSVDREAITEMHEHLLIGEALSRLRYDKNLLESILTSWEGIDATGKQIK